MECEISIFSTVFRGTTTMKISVPIKLKNSITNLINELDYYHYIHGTKTENMLSKYFFGNKNLILCASTFIDTTKYLFLRNDSIFIHLIEKINFRRNKKLVLSLLNRFEIYREFHYMEKLFAVSPLAKPIFEEYFGAQNSVSMFVVHIFGEKLDCLRGRNRNRSFGYAGLLNSECNAHMVEHLRKFSDINLT